MFVGVDETGKLCGTAFTEFQEKYTEHPDSHIVFKGYEVIEFYKVCEAAKKLHGQIPQLGIVHLDFTLDNKGNVIVIEANTYDSSIWLPQMAVGKVLLVIILLKYYNGFLNDRISDVFWIKKRL